MRSFRASRGNWGGVRHIDGVRAGLDEAAVAAAATLAVGVGCGRIQRAAHMGGARGHAAQQNDLAALLLHRARLNDAGVVDYAGQQAVAGAGAQQHLAAIGLDQPAVLGQGVDLVLLYLQAQQLAAGKVQAHGAARAQSHGAAGGIDAA